jgi:hypothetical protein
MTRRLRPYHLRFPRRPRPKTQWPGFPAGYGSPFHEPEDPLPGRPGSKVTEPPCSASFTDFEAFLPLSSPFTRRRVAPPPRPMLSWPSAPPEFVPTPSEPRTPPDPRARDRRSSRASSLTPPREHEDRSPRTRVRPLHQPKKVNQPARQYPALFRTGPHHLSVATPSPTTFARRSPAAVALGASK